MTVAGGEVTVYSSYGPSGSGTTFGIGNWNLSAFGGAVPSYVATNGSTPATFAISAGLGSITLGSTIGASRSLLSLSLASSTEISLNGNISTLKSQTYTGPVLLASAITLATTNSSANPTGATYNTSDDITFTSTVNSTTSTARNLTVATGFGDITFSGAVGGVQPLSTVALTSTGSTTFSGSVNASTFSQAGTTGTTILQGGGIATTSVQTYGNNVSLRVQDVTLTASAVTLHGTLTGAYGLVVNGNAVFGNEDSDRITLSGTNKSLTVTGNTSIYTDSISTSGVQTYGDSTADAITLYTTTSLSTASANKDISFNGTLNSATSTAKGLTISTGSGAVSFGAAVGNIYGLGATSINAGSVAATSTLSIASTANITTTTSSTGTQTYTGAVTLGGPSSFTSSNSNITFSSTLNSLTSARSVTIAAGTGTVTFAGAVGGVLALGATTITAGTLNVSDDFYTSGTTTINASSMQTAATKAFSVISGASATLNVDSLVVGAAMTGSV